MELNVNLPSLSIPLGEVTRHVGGEGWTLGDWTQFINVWKKQEKSAEGELQMSPAISQVTDTITVSPRGTTRDGRRHRDQDDPMVKASTDHVSAVFDWIVDQAPSPGGLSSSGGKAESKKAPKKDLATKMDLEKFYVSLTRRLYDEVHNGH